MKRHFIALLAGVFAFAALNNNLAGKTIVVDKSGLGQHTTIQAAVTAALAKDTVKVFPGVYNEQVVVSKDIVLQGSGYEYTRIIADVAPAMSISAGKVMWFAISSTAGNAVNMSGGIVTNCVLSNSPRHGVYYNGSSPAKVQNCVVVNNAQLQGEQIYAETPGLTVVNTIIWTFPSGLDRDRTENSCCGNKIGILYCRTRYAEGTSGISVNPQFVSSTEFMLMGTSPCVDKGQPELNDPDGTRSDMGYYGGPDAPISPVVTELRIFVNPNGTVNVQATAKSTY
jgi:hypothetical protein